MNRLPATTAAFALLASPSIGQSVFELDDIIFSAGFTPVEEERYGRSVSVVDSEEIEQRGLATVTEALRSLPGVSVSASGGNTAQVRIRGGEANHTLILIDGIEAAGGDGEYILSGLDVANVERIEVLRGPNSVFYGSNASAGVINIITRRGSIGQEGRVTLETGGRNSATAFLSSRNETGGVAASVGWVNDLGYDYSGENGERDGIRRGTISLSGDYFVTDDLQLGFTLRSSEETSDFDSTDGSASSPGGYVVDNPLPYAERQEFAGDVFANLSMMDGLIEHRLSYQLTSNDEARNGGAFTTTETSEIAYRMSWALDGTSVENAEQVLNVMVEAERDTSSADAANERESISYALEYRGSFDNGVNLQAGLRYDDNNQFEDILVWNVAGSYEFGRGVRLHASAGTGSVNPSYFQLTDNFFPAFPPFTTTNTEYIGNSALTPERNRSFDIGVEFPILQDRGTIDITYFNETLTDEIETEYLGFDPGTNTDSFTFVNQQGDSTREGLEVFGSLQATDDLSLRMAYTFLEAENPDGSVEIRRPRHEMLLGGSLEVLGGRGLVTADFRHVSGNFDTQFFGASETLKLPDYTVVDLGGRYWLNDRIAITGRVENLFDEEYSDVWGYASRPLTAYVGLEAKF
jgi:vitamin B12 transporter